MFFVVFITRNLFFHKYFYPCKEFSLSEEKYLSTFDFRSGNKNIRIGILVQHLGRSLLSS